MPPISREAVDCRRVFGFYLHHFPYFGMRGPDDAAALARAGERTRELYEAEFGAAPGRTDSAFCSVAREAFCSAAGAAFCSAYHGGGRERASGVS